MSSLVVSPWTTSSSQLLRGRRGGTHQRVARTVVTLEDGTELEAGDGLLAMINALVVEDLAGRRARVEIVPELLTPEEAAQLLGVSRPTVYAWQDSGALDRVDQGNRRMVRLSEVETLLAARADRERVDHEVAQVAAVDVLDDREYVRAMQAARRSGGARAVAKVRARQRAALAAAAAEHAGGSSATTS
ncbi:MAG: helix-turn-helix domain-containing protein [Micrococcales bacterium]|nr:helix-turn-helix domain-containing protein [Micrococcales bacterium]